MKDNINMLENLTVIDMAKGMAPALVSKFLADNGAKVIKVMDDNEQFFYEYYPAYSVWYEKAELNNTAKNNATELEKLLDRADACIVGGEDAPDIERDYDINALSESHPALVVLEIAANPFGSADYRRPSTDILAQARTGLCYEHYSDKPIVMSFEPASYGAALQGLCGLLAALYKKDLDGKGQIIYTSLFEGSLTWVAQLWAEFENPDRTTATQLKDLHPLIFKCADGVWIHLVLGSAGSKYKLYKILGIDDPTVKPGDSGMPDPSNPDPRSYFGDIDLLSEYVSQFESKSLLEAIWAEGVAAEIVLQPGECWSDPQVQYNGIIEKTSDHVRYVGNPLIARKNVANASKQKITSDKPLDGIRIVDFGAYVAGPLASKILSDLGADVIKVEPVSGEPTRVMAMSFNSANRGKKGLALDLKKGIDVAKHLAAQADALTNNFRSGVSERLGIDPASLHKLKGELITLESPGYGSSGPQAKKAAFDLVMQAVCGHEAKGGGENSAPFWNRTYMVDFTAGYLGAVGILAALNYRSRTGNGVSLDVPLLNAGVFLLSEIIQESDGSFIGVRQPNVKQTGYTPDEALYQTKDGWVAIVARSEYQKRELAATLGLPNIFMSSEKSVQQQDFDAISAAVIKHDTKSIAAKLEDVGVWVEPCRKQAEAEIFNDPFYESRGIIQKTQHSVFGKMKDIGTLMSFSESTIGSTMPTLQLGEHSEHILLQAGFAEEEIRTFRNEGIVG